MTKAIVDNQCLIDIADAIRVQNGTTDTYKPSEMAEAISNIETSENLSSELTEQETLLDTQTDKIADAIDILKNKVSGSGAIPGIKCLTSGSFTLEKDVSTSNYYISHDLGEVPNFFLLFADNGIDYPSELKNYIQAMHYIENPYYYNNTTIRYGTCLTLYGNSSGTLISTASSTMSERKCTDAELWINTGSTKKLKAGLKYSWIAGVIDGM